MKYFTFRHREFPARRIAQAAILAAAILLADPPRAHAYVGPGAGFAVASSFLTFLLASISSLFAIVSWPVRQVFRYLRRRRAIRRSKVKRVVILGFDGMDPQLSERYIQQGKLPNLAQLREHGTFHRLATTIPPISPVAWSSFLTGVNPGKHNIYDFLTPDRRRYLPELSSARILAPKRKLRIGGYVLPLGGPQIKPLRKGVPFWHYLAKAGVFCSVIRVPITFPPEKFSGVLLSGMCVPDIQGTQGTFSFHTTRVSNRESATNHVVVPFVRRNGYFESYVPGPPDSLRPEAKAELRATFRVKTKGAQQRIEIQLDGQRVSLPIGEYSDWVEVEFKAGFGVSVKGICRFFLKSIEPELELYATPVNIHPVRPALPISHPMTYSMYLAKLNGLYATLGLAEDTWALNDGYLDDDAFLEQCYLNHQEREQMFFDALAKTAEGVCTCVFDITDRVQHMFWRYFSNESRGGEFTGANRGPHVIEELYARMDALIGRTLEQLSDKTLLLVVSDHGFQAFRRGVNLNSWLHQNGYLGVKKGVSPGDWFGNVDWENTRAYALGMNGIYINQKGRESRGTVDPREESAALRRELCGKLQGLVDPATSRVAISKAYDAMQAFSGPYREQAPDIIVGFGPDYRVSWNSAQGRVTDEVFEVNSKAWSGDHCVDPELVPGVLFSNWKISGEAHSITDVAPTLLELFGLTIPPHMDGKPWSAVPAPGS
jgi:predicted AlkP superfamily phosphohydrolase/phosphomutase